VSEALPIAFLEDQRAGANNCNYDIKLVLLGGNGKAILYSIDLCAATEVALDTKTDNGKTIDTIAVTHEAYDK
jgi:hypothetical protein